MKSALRKLKNNVLSYEAVEVRVRDATCNDTWGAPTSLLAQIADDSYDRESYARMFAMLWKRLNDYQHLRHVLKALHLVDYLVRHGAPRFIRDVRARSKAVERLQKYRYIKEGADIGGDVRRKATSVLKLLSDDAAIEEARAGAANVRERFAGIGGGSGTRARTRSFRSNSGFERDYNGHEPRREERFQREKPEVPAPRGSRSGSSGGDKRNDKKRRSHKRRPVAAKAPQEEDPFGDAPDIEEELGFGGPAAKPAADRQTSFDPFEGQPAPNDPSQLTTDMDEFFRASSMVPQQQQQFGEIDLLTDDLNNTGASMNESIASSAYVVEPQQSMQNTPQRPTYQERQQTTPLEKRHSNYSAYDVQDALHAEASGMLSDKPEGVDGAFLASIQHDGYDPNSDVLMFEQEALALAPTYDNEDDSSSDEEETDDLMHNPLVHLDDITKDPIAVAAARKKQKQRRRAARKAQHGGRNKTMRQIYDERAQSEALRQAQGATPTPHQPRQRQAISSLGSESTEQPPQLDAYGLPVTRQSRASAALAFDELDNASSNASMPPVVGDPFDALVRDTQALALAPSPFAVGMTPAQQQMFLAQQQMLAQQQLFLQQQQQQHVQHQPQHQAHQHQQHHRRPRAPSGGNFAATVGHDASNPFV